jgi:hypothetical protein
MKKLFPSIILFLALFAFAPSLQADHWPDLKDVVAADLSTDVDTEEIAAVYSSPGLTCRTAYTTFTGSYTISVYEKSEVVQLELLPNYRKRDLTDYPFTKEHKTEVKIKQTNGQILTFTANVRKDYISFDKDSGMYNYLQLKTANGKEDVVHLTVDTATWKDADKTVYTLRILI